jgi:thiol:disulfide interchange protein DsbA
MSKACAEPDGIRQVIAAMHHVIAPRLRALTLAALLLAGGVACSADFKEGEHYKALKPAQPTSVGPGKVEVVEVFWYACGHCFLIEPSLDNWARKEKPANVELVRVPAMWNDLLKTHARVFYTAEVLGKLPALHGEIYREINVRGNRLDTPAKIEAFFTSKGVSKQDFQKAFSSFAVETKLARAADLNKRYRITSTPTVVVNGRYVTDVQMAGSEAALFNVVNDLAARETPAG